MTGGRPLRFLAVLLCGWTGMRAVALYRDGGTTALVAPIADTVAAVAAALGITPARATAAPWVVPKAAPARTPTKGVPSATREPPALASVHNLTPEAVAPFIQTTPPPNNPTPPLLPLAVPPRSIHTSSRLGGSAWGIARGGGIAQASGGQLGGSQAGVRLTYALGRSRRLALSARVSTPLAGKGAEGAIGLDWQPTRLPLHILAERRIALDGGPGATMLGIVGGYGPSPVAGKVTLEGYGQAGMIARDGVEGFIDGALRLAHPVATVGKTRLDLGLGAWGGAQRGAARLDIGPSLGLVLPVAAHGLRLTADWRQRIAGDARPDSGPALSIGTNF